jgi:FkbM family methyltransferase
MGIKQKIGTAFRILTTEGIRAFIEALRYSIANLRNPDRPDETGLAFQVLEGESRTGLMIDVGAHHGFGLSRFAENGWQVFAFEPDSENRAELKTKYGDLPNVVIDPRAVSDQKKETAILFKSQESSGMSGLSSFHPSHSEAENVEVTTLSIFLDEQGIIDQEIDFLKVDTEGYDLFVLNGIPWDKSPPALILCEFEDTKTKPLGYNFHDLAQFLQDRGYRIIVSEWHPIKKYGGLHDWKRFTTYPCELADPRAWGNILGSKDEKVFDKLLLACNLID